jgi:hypothetical protein
VLKKGMIIKVDLKLGAKNMKLEQQAEGYLFHHFPNFVDRFFLS